MVEEGRIVFVAVDSSEASDKALQYGITEQYRPGDRILLVHVVLGALGHAGERTLVYTESFKHKPAKEYEFIEERFGSKLSAAGIPYRTVILLADKQEESIADALVRYALEVKAHSIIIAKHDKGVKKWLSGGGVVKNVIELSPIPVVVLNTVPKPHSIVKGAPAVAPPEMVEATR